MRWQNCIPVLCALRMLGSVALTVLMPSPVLSSE
jgi:hypothetical protein